MPQRQRSGRGSWGLWQTSSLGEVWVIYLDFTSRRAIYTHFKTEEIQIPQHHSWKLDSWWWQACEDVDHQEKPGVQHGQIDRKRLEVMLNPEKLTSSSRETEDQDGGTRSGKAPMWLLKQLRWMGKGGLTLVKRPDFPPFRQKLQVIDFNDWASSLRVNNCPGSSACAGGDSRADLPLSSPPACRDLSAHYAPSFWALKSTEAGETGSWPDHRPVSPGNVCTINWDIFYTWCVAKLMPNLCN